MMTQAMHGKNKMAKRTNYSKEQVDDLTRAVEKLTIIIHGSTELDKKGLMQSQKEDDEKFKRVIETIQKSNGEIKKEMAEMKASFEQRFNIIEHWQRKIQNYINAVLSGTFWKVVFGTVIGFISFVIWAKGGWHACLEFLKQFIKIKI